MVYSSGAASASTVAMNINAVTATGEAFVSTSSALVAAMGTLSHSLDPVRQTWYASGSQSGNDAQIAETRLRSAINDINQIIHNLGRLVQQSAMDGAALDGQLATQFQSHSGSSVGQGL